MFYLVDSRDSNLNNIEQFYVAASRIQDDLRVYTNDKEEALENQLKTGSLATSIFDHESIKEVEANAGIDGPDKDSLDFQELDKDGSASLDDADKDKEDPTDELGLSDPAELLEKDKEDPTDELGLSDPAELLEKEPVAVGINAPTTKELEDINLDLAGGMEFEIEI